MNTPTIRRLTLSCRHQLSALAPLTLAAAQAQNARWTYTNQLADWPGQDYGCSKGAKPSANFCDENNLGNVAVCWGQTGTILPGRTAATISGTIVCDPATTVTLNFLTLNQTGRKTQFSNALDPNVPATLACNGAVQTWQYTVLVVFSISGRLHKGKSGVTVRFDDGAGDPAHTAFATVFIQQHKGPQPAGRADAPFPGGAVPLTCSYSSRSEPEVMRRRTLCCAAL